MIRLHISIDDILRVWVRRWASHRGCRGYPSLQSFMREATAQITKYSIDELSEEQYLKLDEAVMTLHDLNLEAYQVLMAVFLQGQDKKNICLEMQISPRTYDNRLRTARDFMEGAVFGSGLIKVKF
ncbi:ECF-type sigma factor [Glaesserella parasuis]|uniref:ECF-type sigma factor n=1 Tax=Glaesserella parasuis TaxID=738 RepID=UPI0027208C05|nr:antiterminator Q family protein [Glaesserella parasuis]MDO9692930.1 antiterminator Q family protein [Glaesserella parasuis]MDO9761534.1 antiterminator Q family protein [Glaesserella parasuis]MDO9794701.1 antiterminator Q family protein [Glaesserella parasuis]